MKYNGYDVEETPEGITIKGIKDFDLVHTFGCGQCFRWHRLPNGSYSGVVKGKSAVVSLDAASSRLLIAGADIDDFKNIWFDYFDLSTDYSSIKKAVAKDEIMREAVRFGHGMRLLRQDPWETVVSFIISANNRIPMIMKVVGNISSMYGRKICEGDESCSFPDPQQLSGLHDDEMKACRAGFRCRYIIDAAEMISSGKLDLESLRHMTTDDARRALMSLPGVGCKVADCTLLYSGIKYDVFPADVWIKRIMETLYFKREASLKEIQQFAADYFGAYAGYAQQYLFYYARENRIGAKT